MERRLPPYILVRFSVIGLGLAGIFACGREQECQPLESGKDYSCVASTPDNTDTADTADANDGSSDLSTDTAPTDYAPGPFGLEEGDIIANLSFSAIDGTTFTFGDVFADSEAKVLLVSTSAEWCTACREEQPLFEQLYQDHAADGLRVVVTMFQDSDYFPAEVVHAERWRDQYNLTFPVVVDAPFVLSEYYDEALTPMNMVVEVPSMKIRKIETGAISGSSISLIELLLR